MTEKFSSDEIDIIIDYVEAAEPHINPDLEVDCGCDDWSVCPDCASLARTAGLVLKTHGYPHAYSDGALSIDARQCAERIYCLYCRQYGREGIGVTM